MSYDEALEIMVRFKLDGKVIGDWYGEITKNKDNRLTREKFVIKLAEILKFLGVDRNNGLTKQDSAFIRRDDILNCIGKYPRMLTKLGYYKSGICNQCSRIYFITQSSKINDFVPKNIL